MPLQASGAISLSNLRTEFGGSAPDSLSEHYRGGGLVPNISVNNGVPTSGLIRLSNFYGASSFMVNLVATNLFAIAFSSPATPNTATAGIKLKTNGARQNRNVSSPGNPFDGDLTTEWTNPIKAGQGANYEARLTVNSGSSPNGGSSAINSFLALSTERIWELTISTIDGSVTGDWTLEIRLTSGAVVASITFNITAQVVLPI